MSVLHRHLLFLLVAVLILVGCSQSASQARSNTPIALAATATFRPVFTPGLLMRTPTASPDHSTPTAGLAEAANKQFLAPEPLSLEQAPVPNVLQVGLCSPLAGIALEELKEIISSPYDPPPAGKEDRHHGVDFAYYRRGEQPSIQGTGVQTILPGVVAMALVDSFPYGNVVIVESDPASLEAQSVKVPGIGDGESLYTLYAHLEEAPQVQVGQGLAACQLFGVVGKSGNAGVAHLHLETRLGPAGATFERMGYYLAESTGQEKENYLRWRIGGEFHHFDPMAVLDPESLP